MVTLSFSTARDWCNFCCGNVDIRKFHSFSRNEIINVIRLICHWLRFEKLSKLNVSWSLDWNQEFDGKFVLKHFGNCFQGSCGSGYNSCEPAAALIPNHHHVRENKTDTELALRGALPPWNLDASSRNHRKVLRRRTQSITVTNGPTGTNTKEKQVFV